ncbi:short-chain dehydrogenase [Rhodovulum sp. 12E13]|uniref:short-chain dehydrogenase n=1 Tax=Rhodovulum sp. 12E13 TaxID=2203891 RepID=UPI001F2B03DE|nr:short-chain dehydrogenase [Rhodovulum sp. 12E13]
MAAARRDRAGRLRRAWACARRAAASLVVCDAGLCPDKGKTLADDYPAAIWAETFATDGTDAPPTVQAGLPSLQATIAAGAPARLAILAWQMSSTERPPGGSCIYRASRAAAVNLGRNLATDLAGLGLAVGIYHPGWGRTAMGGTDAEIPVEEAADGLMDRFEALTVETTGQFPTRDRRAHPC